MDQRIRRLITMGAVALVCLVLVTAPVPAAQRDPLRAASIALSAHLVTAVHLEGFGATYGHRPRVPLRRTSADIDLTQDVDDHAAGLPEGGARRAATVRAVPPGAEVSFTVNGQAVHRRNQREQRSRSRPHVGRRAGPGRHAVETLFRDYEKTPSGVWFPTHITRSQGGQPALDLWLSSVRVDMNGGRP
jgi:hypothetical protein